MTAKKKPAPVGPARPLNDWALGKGTGVDYSSNNSGGNFWLKDKDWLALEKAGWWVQWGGVYFCHSEHGGLFGEQPADAPTCPTAEACSEVTHRRYPSGEALLKLDRKARGAFDVLATHAFLPGAKLGEAIESFERATGQSASALGCPCCGPPHCFTYHGPRGEYDYYSPNYPDEGEPYDGE